MLDTDTYIVVWTTTPFTVTASRALTVGPDMDYVVVKPANNDRKFVVAEGLLDSLAEKFGWESFEVLAKHKGTELEYIVTEHPWDTEVDELVILGDHVTLDSGTGVVHTAPGFGEDDYNVGVKYGLEVFVTVEVQPVYAEKTLENIPLSFERLAENLKILPESESLKHVSLKLGGDLLAIEKAEKDSVKIFSDCSKISEPGDYELTVNYMLPAGVKILEKTAEKVMITVELSGMETEPPAEAGE